MSERLEVFVPETPTFSILESKAGGRLRSIGGDLPSVGSANLGPNVLRAGNGFRCGPNMSNGGTWTNFRGDTCGIDLTAALSRSVRGATSDGSALSPLPKRGSSSGKKGKFSSSIDSFKERTTSLFEARSTPDRIRLSVDSVHPEAISDEPPKVRMAKLRELRPTKLFPNSRSRKKTLDITDEDTESEKYIRSLGVTLLREIDEEVSSKGISDEDKFPAIAALERRAAEIEQQLDQADGLVDAVLRMIESRTGFSPSDEDAYMTRMVRSSKNEYGFDIPTLTNRVRNRKKKDPDDFVNVHVKVMKLTDGDGNDVELEIAMAEGPASAGLKPLVTFRKVGKGNIDLDNADPNDPIEAAASNINGLLNRPFSGQSTLERISSTADLRHSMSEVFTMRSRETTLTPQESAARDAVRTVLERNGVKFGSLDDSEIVFQLDKTGTPVKQTDMAIVVHAESGGLNPSEAEDVLTALKEIFEFLPEPWAETLKKNGINIAFAKRGENYRAQHMPMNDGSSIISMPHFWTDGTPDMKTLDDFKSTLLHEMMHAIQSNNPEMNEAEFIHFMMRTNGDTKGRKLKEIFPDLGYDDDEIAVPDDADSAYMFKIYKNWKRSGRPIRISEMSAMLMQALDGRSTKTKGDLDALAWMLGLMLEQGSR